MFSKEAKQPHDRAGNLAGPGFVVLHRARAYAKAFGQTLLGPAETLSSLFQFRASHAASFPRALHAWRIIRGVKPHIFMAKL